MVSSAARGPERRLRSELDTCVTTAVLGYLPVVRIHKNIKTKLSPLRERLYNVFNTYQTTNILMAQADRLWARTLVICAVCGRAVAEMFQGEAKR